MTKLETSIGKNSLGSMDLFKEREKYDQIISDTSLKKYDISLYGRVNEKFQVILPTAETIKGVTNIVSAANFLALAYEDFLKMINKAKTRGFKTDGPYGELIPKSGYYDLEAAYHGYINGLYRSFSTTYLKSEGKEDKIHNFYEFCEEFVQFFNRASQFPITKAGFIESKYNSNMSTGLFISVVDEDASDDSLKFKYLNDKNFKFVSDAAKFFGMAVDSNAPWKFMADIRSPAMENYLTLCGTSKDNVFKTNFQNAENVYSLASYLRMMYQVFVQVNPLNRSNDTESLEYPYFARMYLYFRLKEKNWNLSQNEFETEVRKIISFSSHVGYNGAIQDSLLTLRSKGTRIGLCDLIW